jgi:hypothetical protein
VTAELHPASGSDGTQSAVHPQTNELLFVKQPLLIHLEARAQQQLLPQPASQLRMQACSRPASGLSAEATLEGQSCCRARKKSAEASEAGPPSTEEAALWTEGHCVDCTVVQGPFDASTLVIWRGNHVLIVWIAQWSRTV